MPSFVLLNQNTTAISQILVIFGSKYAGILLFQFDITELFNIELMQ